MENWNQPEDHTTASNTTGCAFQSQCGYKLPCGKCRLTMTYCPDTNTVTITPSWITTLDCNGSATR